MRIKNVDRWQEDALNDAVRTCTSVRQVIAKLGLKPAGGNYKQFYRYIQQYAINTDHFLGQGWVKGKIISREPIYSLKEILVRNGSFQSHKLKRRLFRAGIKEPRCEECGWCKVSEDGRLSLELDHINGDNRDNRLENLRILCPNCHSLKPTHRGSNIAFRRRGGEIGIHATLKML